jgi:glycosidase
LRNHDQTRTLTELGGDVARARIAATLLLTLPGLPFVYYGEEIGMTGTKPDERLRTPMHWSRETGIGFTKGTAWQKLHPDSLIANVEVQDANPRSLLNVYRRLIHLRAEHSALGSGELVPLASSSDAVAAYLRRDSSRAVLVIVNLGRTPLSNVTLASDPGALAAGRYSTRPLLGGPVLAPLTVTADGRIQGYVPLRSVGAMASYLVELVPAR